MMPRKERPMSREISWVRPPMRPLTDSGSERSWVARGNIAYSAVTQPSPLPLRQRGTPSDTLAATRTRVLPYSTRTDPSAWSSQLRVIRTSRSWSASRPSILAMRATLSGETDKSEIVGHELRQRLDVGDEVTHQPAADAGELLRVARREEPAVAVPRQGLEQVAPRQRGERGLAAPVSYTHLRAHEPDSYLVCRLLLDKKK